MKEEISKYLEVIKRAVSKIENLLGTETVQIQEIQEVQQIQAQAFSSSIDRNKFLSDVMSLDEWPVAIENHLCLPPTDKDKIDRANSNLLTMIDRSMEGVNFLDFGCGEGWLAQQAIHRGVAESTGYDIKHSKTWNTKSAKYTHIYNELSRSHYDIIVLFDVLDHCEDPISVMSQVKSLLKKDGSVYIRCHPWTGSYATHVCKQGLNKAYIHLFLTYEEIASQIQEPPIFTRIEKDAFTAYHWCFKDFEIQKERVYTEDLDPFFKQDEIKQMLALNNNLKQNEIEKFLKLMEIQMIDYTLVNKKF